MARACGEIFAEPAQSHNVGVVGERADQRQRVVGLEQAEERRAQEDAGNEFSQDHRGAEPSRQSAAGERGDEEQRHVHHIKVAATTGTPIAKTVALIASHAYISAK